MAVCVLNVACFRRRFICIAIFISTSVLIYRIFVKFSFNHLLIPKPRYNFSWTNAVTVFKVRSPDQLCRYTIQGSSRVTDEDGFVCTRDDLLPSGCCNRTKRTSSQFVCSSCSRIKCCYVYEYCVSCCLNPSNRVLWRRVLEIAENKNQRDILFADSPFELCTSRCRTSSESIAYANTYRDTKWRFCFGVDPPVLRLLSTV
uniref:SREBP regulating gene protein n=1 Tax=Mesocestoides corti TaxID=53468 RepID=A0A5K3EHJ0_MESCO